ncbi:MAG: hypothetical protein NC097_04100 [Clostridium sp.]|nr:hypothetical protein [Prevotella sp.]MCM1428959.1 hypothetical protein [Clostridium sp.]MCM1475993.1 hypothetical protein [Muribaculaceae bacterium]
MRKITRQLTAVLMLTTAITAFGVDFPRPQVSPAVGNTPDPISKVTLTFAGAEDIAFSARALNYYNPDEKVDKTGIIYFGGDEIEQFEGSYTTEISGNSVSFIPLGKNTGEPEAWTIQGKYQLFIPAGAITMKIEGTPISCPEMEFNWWINDLGNAYFTPGEGIVDSFTNLTLHAPEGFEFAGGYIKLSLYQPCIYKVEKGQKTGNCLGRFGLANDASITGVTELQFQAPIDPYTRKAFVPKEGEKYIIELPQSAIKMRKLTNPTTYYVPKVQILWEYNTHKEDDTTGIDEVATEKVTDVYDLSGRLVKRGATATDIGKLAKGIYITSGKKIQVR